MSDLRREIKEAINRNAAERGSHTPDFILADYLLGCLDHFDKAVRARDRWYDVSLSPGGKGKAVEAPQAPEANENR